MAWFGELTECNYFGEELSPFLRAVGWLESGKPFPTGRLPDQQVFSKLVEFSVDPWQPAVFTGVHDCDLCVYKFEACGSKNLFVPSDDFAYVCPELVIHYMNAHAFCPPASFCTAVLACPPMRSIAYLKAMLQCARPIVQLTKQHDVQ
jgi:hypothetical protein